MRSAANSKKEGRVIGPEKPLPPGRALRLAVFGAAVILLFYFGCFLALALIGVLIALDLALLIACARFGLAGVMKAPIRALSGLLALLAGGLNLTKQPKYRIELKRSDGPALFDLVETMAQRAQVPAPDKILLNMTNNAWVQLRGYHQGRGQCTLCVGYDLLTVFTTQELSAVLAHEMAHARLVQRGYSGWLSKGVRRITQLARRLQPWTGRHNRKPFLTAEALAVCVRKLGRTAARLYAAYTRQDEFAADSLAAEICGSGVYRRMLENLHISGIKGGAFTWRDRLVQIQKDESFSNWLRSQLVPSDPEEYSRLQSQALEPRETSAFSTHPSLGDRLAALPGPRLSDAADDPQSALALLSEPNAIAAALMAEIERVALVEEHKRAESLRRGVQKRRKARKHTAGQYAGLFVIVIGAFTAVFALVIAGIASTAPHGASAMPQVLIALLIAVCLVAAGARLIHVYRFQERIPLAIPPFAIWQATMRLRKVKIKLDAQNEAQSLADELRPQLPSIARRRRDQERFWSDEAYRCLSKGQFLRARAASMLCLEVAPRSFEGRLAGGFAAAYAGDVPEVNRLAGSALVEYGVGAGTSAAMGCALTILSKWQKGESYLLDALQRRPDEATLWSLLAICQWRQSKPREAVQSARLAVTRNPLDIEHRVLLLKMLIAAGQIRDAREELVRLKAAEPDHPYLYEAGIRLALAHGSVTEAQSLAHLWEKSAPEPQNLIDIAGLFSEQKDQEIGRAYLERAAACGFYPAALVGLARLSFVDKNFESTRALLLAACDLTKDVPTDSQSPFAFFDTIFKGLQSLGQTEDGCNEGKAEIVLTPAERERQSTVHHPPLTKITFVAYASSRAQADDGVLEIFHAMFPSSSVGAERVQWHLATGAESAPATRRPGVCACDFA